MKPISIEFQCFGPFPGKVSIDFTDVGREGLFLICGDTGAGKTTLLDAISYALYYAPSSASRKDKNPGKGEFDKMRCKYVEDSDPTPTYVQLVLEKDGALYRITRTLAPRKRASGFAETHAYERWDGADWMPVLANPGAKNVTEAATKLVGLDADQFRQIIILPQGRFEQLLVSDSTAKTEILSTLFGADHWAGAVRRMRDQAMLKSRMLESDRQKIGFELKRFGCADTKALGVLITETENGIPAMEAAEKQAAEVYGAAIKAEKDAGPTEQLFRDLDARLRAVQMYEQAEPGMKAKRERMEAAAKADRLRGDLAELQMIRRDAEAAKRAFAGKDADLRAKQFALEKAQQLWNRHEAGRGAQADAAERRVKLESSVQVYAEFETLRVREMALKKAKDEAAAFYAQREKAKAAADQALNVALLNRQKYVAIAEDISARYVLGAAGRLAQKLEEGMPCPVCGSIHHPAPAQLTDDIVTDEMQKRAEETAKLYRERYDAAVDAQRKAADALTDALSKKNKAEGDYEANHALLESRAKDRVEGIADGRALEKRILDLKAQIEAYDRDEKQLRAALDAAANACGNAKGARDEAQKALDARTGALNAAETGWAKLLAGNGYANEAAFTACLMEPARLDALRKEISDYDGNLAHARAERDAKLAETEGRQRPDMKALKEASDLALKRQQEAHTALIEAKRQLAEKIGKFDELQKAEIALQKAETEYQRLKGFVDMIDNSNGINLHRYLLAAMLTLVIDQANRLLLNVHGGRYQLVRSDESAGKAHKAGLEFNVNDSSTGSIRSVNSLSGGEKFLVSLALAIGLNTVMRAQVRGIRVDALFIDEGFGSLDADSINDAMQMLNIVRDGNNMVGVISHIEALQKEIPVHIEVKKDTVHGSTLKIC